MRDHYQFLGLKPQASAIEIRRAYLRLAKKYHPDVNAGDEQAEERFKLLQESYRVLSDSLARRDYDAAQTRQQNPRPRVRPVSMSARTRRHEKRARVSRDPNRPVYHRPPLYRPVFKHWGRIGCGLFWVIIGSILFAVTICAF